MKLYFAGYKGTESKTSMPSS